MQKYDQVQLTLSLIESAVSLMEENGGTLCLTNVIQSVDDLFTVYEVLSKSNGVCVELNLAHNSLGALQYFKGLEFLLLSLKSTLKTLVLSENELGNAGMELLRSTVASLPCLEQLNLTSNWIGLEEALLLIQEIGRNELTPFQLVFYNNSLNDTQVIRLLVECKKYGITAKIETTKVLIAAEQGDFEMLRFLVESDISLETDREFFSPESVTRTALDICVANGHMDCVQHLLEFGSYLNSSGVEVHFDVEAALAVAFLMNQEDIIHFMLRLVSPTPACLRVAAAMNNTALVDLCLNGRIGVNCGRSEGRMTPLQTAVTVGQVTMVQYLISAGAALDGPTMLAGSTALHLAARSGNLLVCNTLLQCGAYPNLLDDRGWSPLHEAANSERWPMCSLLLDSGASLSAQSKKVGTPYRVAVAAGSSCPLELRLRMCVAEKEISLRGLGLSVVPEELRLATRLASLDLRDNPIDDLPVWLCELPLKQLLLIGCPLQKVPQSVVNSPVKSILSFLVDIGNPEKTMIWRTAKLMVLGKEAAGKTTLMTRIRDQKSKYDLNLSTDGIDVLQFKLGDLNVQWFDFGGQEVFYPTHQFFLTPQCVYLVVFSLTDDDFLQRIQYWLAIISNYARGSGRPPRVAVVGTFLDQADQERLLEVRAALEPLVLKHRFVKGYLTVSCRTGENIDETRAAIHKMFVDSGLAEQQVPCSYQRVHGVLQDQREAGVKVVSWADMHSMISWMSEEQLNTCVTFLHYMGLLFSSPDVGVVLDVKWLASTFATVISFKSSWADKGQVSPEDLQHVWKDVPDHQALISLFVRFGIAFQLRSGHLVIPSLFPVQRSSGAVLRMPSLSRRFQRRMQLPVVPLGLVGRLAVRLKTHPSRVVHEIWRSGCLLSNSQHSQWAEVCVSGRMLVLNAGCTADSSDDSLLVWMMQEITDIVFQTFLVAEEDVFVSVTCSHCLMANAPFPQYLEWGALRDSVLQGDLTFSCSTGRVQVAELGSDIALRVCTVYEEGQVSMQHKIGAGAFGDVFRGSMVSDGTLVAVKQMQQQAGSRALREFLGECALMGQLQHPLIVRLYGIIIKPSLCMVLELVPEGDLHTKLINYEIATDEIRQRIAADIAIGMTFLHNQPVPVAHRDLRSPNVLVASLDPSADACAKVADFGLSVGITSARTDSLASWQWLPPEVLLGQSYSEACDVYSYGMVLYEIYSDGTPPFDEYQQFTTRRENVVEYFCPVCAADWYDENVEFVEEQGAAEKPVQRDESLESRGRQAPPELRAPGVGASAGAPRSRSRSPSPRRSRSPSPKPLPKLRTRTKASRMGARTSAATRRLSPKPPPKRRAEAGAAPATRARSRSAAPPRELRLGVVKPAAPPKIQAPVTRDGLSPRRAMSATNILAPRPPPKPLKTSGDEADVRRKPLPVLPTRGDKQRAPVQRKRRAQIRGGAPAAPICSCGGGTLSQISAAWKETLDKQSAIREIAEEGLRPSVPSAAPGVLSAMMERCWKEADLRPSFSECVEQLKGITRIPNHLLQSVLNVKRAAKGPSLKSAAAVPRILQKQICLLETEVLCMEKIGQWVYLGGRQCSIVQMDAMNPENRYSLSSLHSADTRIISVCGVGNYLWTAAQDMVINGVPLDLVDSFRESTTSNAPQRGFLKLSSSRNNLGDDLLTGNAASEPNSPASRRGAGLKSPRAFKAVSKTLKKTLKSFTPSRDSGGRWKNSGSAVIKMEHHQAETTAMVALSSGQSDWVVSGDSAGRICIVRDGAFLLSLEVRQGHPVVALQHTARPHVILAVVGSHLYSVDLNKLTASCVRASLVSSGFIRGTALHQDTLFMANGSTGDLLVLNVSSLEAPRMLDTLRAVAGRIYALERISIGARVCLFIGGEGVLCVWDLSARSMLATIEVEGRVKAIIELGPNLVWAAHTINTEQGAHKTVITHLEFAGRSSP